MLITFYYHATHVNSMILNGESAAFKLGKEGRISHATVLLKKILLFILENMFCVYPTIFNPEPGSSANYL